ncbi:hypothetical protein C0966_00545 [Bacillus methanolicus]|uniref:hypothetical protein n=1 Tax=Bacillus methanolicus TaxID=1471 RepID=UPI00238060B8|nr:hypothetical protein [Bacillus methanolicus]MDE3837897.1 hypothetical protein [Bacillus methanolicus]
MNDKDIQPIIISPEKAERLKTIVEGIVSRHYGKEIKITKYTQDFSGLEQLEKSKKEAIG